VTTTTDEQERCASGHFMHHGATACACGAPTRARRGISLAKPRPQLPWHDHAKACTTSETAAGRAAMTAVGLGIPVPVRAWTGHPDGTATAALPGGATIRYVPDAPRPFQTAIPCPGGAHHFRTAGNRTDWADAFAEAGACIGPHADFDGWATAAARDLSAAFAARHVTALTPVIPLHQKGERA